MFLIEKSVEFYSFYDCDALICVVIIVKKCRSLHKLGNKMILRDKYLNILLSRGNCKTRKLPQNMNLYTFS